VATGLSGVTLLARITGTPGVPITQATLTGVAWTLTNLTTGVVAATGTFVVGASVYDSLQQADGRWTADSLAAPSTVDGLAGYNFLGTLAAALFAAAVPVAGVVAPPPTWFQADVAFTPVSGQPFRQSWRFPAGAVFG
jgi:hypothetical protein